MTVGRGVVRGGGGVVWGGVLLLVVEGVSEMCRIGLEKLRESSGLRLSVVCDWVVPLRR